MTPGPHGAGEWAHLIRQQNGWSADRQAERLREKARQQVEESRAPVQPPEWVASPDAERLAASHLARALAGKLPPEVPQHDRTAAPRWAQLPGDPPELRAWLASQPAGADGPN